MKSGLRGGKPRDMATFKKGGTSRGAGAAKKGFDYAIYKKGGKVKKYEEGGGVETRKYASFSDWMGDLFGKKKAADALDETTTRAIRETERARPAAAPEEDRETRRPAPGAARAMLPTAQRARMQRRRPAGPGFLPSDEAVTGPRRSLLPRPMTPEERYYEQPDRSASPESAYYRKGGGVMMAGGGSCRGMGAAQRGGKYTIK